MYRLTTESHRTSRTMLSNSQNNCSSSKQIGQIFYFHVTLVRAYLRYTCLVLHVGLMPDIAALFIAAIIAVFIAALPLTWKSQGI